MPKKKKHKLKTDNKIIEEVIRGNLKRVYTKLGLLIWEANK